MAISYIDRKNKELEELNTFLSDKNNKKLLNFTEIQRKKELIVKKIKAKNFNKYYHNLSSKTKNGVLTENFEYTYTYERFNGFINVPSFANTFYKINKAIKTATYFTNCGMTAICAVLLSLISSNEAELNLMYEETYFETIKFINMIMKSSSKNQALYIDSIASDFSFKTKSLLNYKIVVIDTTCFRGPQFNMMIEKIIRNGIPCVLVRSHTKLDLLATEYSHIGSISFVYPTVKNEKKLFAQKLELDTKHLIGVMGACLSPDKMPPLMFSKEIKRLNDTRIKIVQENNELFFKVLKDNKINVVLPNHKQFCLIFLEDYKDGLELLKEEVKLFCKANELEYLTYPAVSFGFDYISIDCYQNFNDGAFKIRACINDFPPKIIISFAHQFINFIINLH